MIRYFEELSKTSEQQHKIIRERVIRLRNVSLTNLDIIDFTVPQQVHYNFISAKNVHDILPYQFILTGTLLIQLSAKSITVQF